MKKKAEIRKYWNQKAESTKEYIPDITMKDVCLRELEIESICNLLKKKSRGHILDIGCGNGYSSYKFSKYAKSIVGADYSTAMIERCKENPAFSETSNISFRVADVLSLTKDIKEKFDICVTERCLINMATFNEQKKAITEICKALKPKGQFFMLEGFEENFIYLNNHRSNAGLDKIELDWHNLLFNKKEINLFLKKQFRIVNVINFGVYYFISRIFHPLYVSPEEPRFNSRINTVAKDLSLIGNDDFEKYSILELYVLEKK